MSSHAFNEDFDDDDLHVQYYLVCLVSVKVRGFINLSISSQSGIWALHNALPLTGAIVCHVSESSESLYYCYSFSICQWENLMTLPL
jgi:hypothetical protein